LSAVRANYVGNSIKHDLDKAKVIE